MPPLEKTRKALKGEPALHKSSLWNLLIVVGSRAPWNWRSIPL